MCVVAAGALPGGDEGEREGERERKVEQKSKWACKLVICCKITRRIYSS